MEQVAVEINSSNGSCRTRINTDDQVPGFSREGAELYPFKALPADPHQDISATVCGNRELIPACHNCALVFECDDLRSRSQGRNLRRCTGFGKRIEPVEADVIPGSNLAKGLLAFPSCHLYEPGLRGQSL